MALVRPRYVRHRVLPRVRHSERFLQWLNAQALRLEITAQEIFALLLAGNSYLNVEAMEPEV